MTAAAPDDPSVTLVEEPSMPRISVLVADVDGAVATQERGDGAYRQRAGVRARMGALCQVIGMKTFGASHRSRSCSTNSVSSRSGSS
jgi:hypothetical protein